MHDLLVEGFDELGTVVEKDLVGKYSASLVWLLDGQVVAKEVITEGRSLSSAMREARDGLDKLALGLSRKQYVWSK